MGTLTVSRTLRRDLITALRYPRTLINSALELERCPHNGMYTDDDPRCVACEDRPECEWLFHNDQFAALAEKPTADLIKALEFALLHVSALATSANHKLLRCDCPNCTWVRHSQALLEREGRGS